MLIPRETYLKKIRKLINQEEIKVIMGVRRCGKTTLLKLIISELKENGVNDENIIHINFESSKYDEIKNYKDLNEYIFKKTENIKGKVYLFFDEIQMVDEWEKSINAYRIDLDSDIYITGSNSKLLSGELSTLLSGRYRQIIVYPFSYKEILQHLKTQQIIYKGEMDVFEKYLTYGGFPNVLKYDLDDKEGYLDDIYNSIVIKDVISKNKIKNIDFLERFLKFIISHIGKTFSSRSISKYLKSDNVSLSPLTINNYLNYAIKAFILIKIPREDIKEKKLLTVNEKYYVVDLGFYHIQRGINTNMGQVLENIVLLELLQRGYEITVGKIKDLEVDFVCKKPNETVYIQIAQTVANEETLKRELKPLKLINDNYKKYLLTLDVLNYSNEGIIHENIIEFLKKEDFS